MEDKKVKKTENMNAYMSQYMKNKYYKDPIKMKMYKNSLNIKKKYEIDEAVWTKYKENLHHIICMKKMIDELPIEMVDLFFKEYKNLVFKEKKE